MAISAPQIAILAPHIAILAPQIAILSPHIAIPAPLIAIPAPQIALFWRRRLELLCKTYASCYSLDFLRVSYFLVYSILYIYNVSESCRPDTDQALML